MPDDAPANGLGRDLSDLARTELARFAERIRDTFIADIGEAKTRMSAPDATDFDRKTYIRTFFAFVEGTLGSQKEMGLSSYRRLRDATPAEYAIQREERYSLTDKGKAESRPALFPLASNVLFGFRTFYRVLGVPHYEANLVDGGWAAFLEAVKIRNRLTHPRSLDESRVTANDVAVVQKAEAWHTAQHAVLQAWADKHTTTPPPQP